MLLSPYSYTCHGCCTGAVAMFARLPTVLPHLLLSCLLGLTLSKVLAALSLDYQPPTLLFPCRALGVPAKNVFANRMNWQCDDETGLPTKLVGFDLREPTAHQGGKPQAIARLRELFPYETIVMVGSACFHSAKGALPPWEGAERVLSVLQGASVDCWRCRCMPLLPVLLWAREIRSPVWTERLAPVLCAGGGRHH